jgi:hypothetical protein
MNKAKTFTLRSRTALEVVAPWDTAESKVFQDETFSLKVWKVLSGRFDSDTGLIAMRRVNCLD